MTAPSVRRHPGRESERGKQVRADGSPELRRLREQLRDQLARAEAAAEPCWLTVETPDVELTALLDHADATVVFDPPDRDGVIGLGAHRRLLDQRGATLTTKATEVLAELSRYACHGGAFTPRFFGALSFFPDANDGPIWEGFPETWFVVPRVLYRRGRMTVALERDELRGEGIQRVRRELDALLTHLAAPRAPQRLVARHEHRMSRADYRAMFTSAKELLDSGRAEKIVAARRTDAQLEDAVSCAELLSRLTARFSGCTRFAARPSGHATFLGASPERLISRAGTEAKTEALAGSIARADNMDDAIHALLSSQKDHAEHAHVVDAIVGALKPFAAQIEQDARPSIRELPNVLHLNTPIGVKLLSPPAHILELVKALHPTPAVGGVPRRPALRWIRDEEPMARGWYAAPFGWFDQDGNGEFVVALRSAIVREDMVHAFAGGGLVAASTCDAEYDEGTVKMSAILRELRDAPKLATVS